MESGFLHIGMALAAVLFGGLGILLLLTATAPTAIAVVPLGLLFDSRGSSLYLGIRQDDKANKTLANLVIRNEAQRF